MKFTCTVEVKAPIAKVVELFDNPDNRKKWQLGLVSFEHLSGNPGQPGAKSRIILEMRNNRIELIETILVRNLPQEMTALYEHEHMVNTMSNRFHLVDESTTRYDAEIEYTKFIGIVPKMMSFIMPGVFKRQAQKMIDRFKTFVETEINGRQTNIR